MCGLAGFAGEGDCDDLRAMTRLRAVFDPDGRANPHKIFPDAKVCVEARAPRRRAAV